MLDHNIILVGFMGTGKSTIGQELAARLGKAFKDTDSEITRKMNMSIPDIFTQQGESGFREIESEVIREVLSGNEQVVATGGGAVLAEINREVMLTNGYVVALTASWEVIVDRVRNDGNRPLIAGNIEERVQTLLEQRRHAYDFAHLTIDTGMLDVERIVDNIIAAYQAD